MFSALSLVFAIAALVFALFGLFILIFLNADVLGWLFIPCLCVYIGLLAFVPALIYHRRELLQIHAYLGDEEFYKRYPREEKWMLHKKAWQERWQRK